MSRKYFNCYSFRMTTYNVCMNKWIQHEKLCFTFNVGRIFTRNWNILLNNILNNKENNKLLSKCVKFKWPKCHNFLL